MLMGLGHAKEPSYGFLVAGVANLLISIALAKPFGLVGIAFGTAIPNIFYALFLVRGACRVTQLPMLTYFKYVYGSIAIASVPVLLLLTFFRTAIEVRTFWQFATTAVVTVALCAFLWFAFVIRGDPYLGSSWRALRERLPIW